MTLYDFVDSIWLGQVEFRDKTSFVLSLRLTLFAVWGDCLKTHSSQNVS